MTPEQKKKAGWAAVAGVAAVIGYLLGRHETQATCCPPGTQCRPPPGACPPAGSTLGTRLT